MKHYPESGWLMSLRDEPQSIWGSVESFMSDIKRSPVRDGRYILDSDVWGRVATKELLPQKGQGIAFYHSTRAKFPSPDEHGRKPRVSLVGELLDVEMEGKEVIHFKVAIDKDTLKYMAAHPIVRTAEMAPVFEERGIKQGSVATFYYAAPEQWKQLLARIERT